ncbi:MAG TPA: hypothetical protein VGF55_09080 [Gemmataceae bacterium]|jgi:hypothetical protein
MCIRPRRVVVALLAGTVAWALALATQGGTAEPPHNGDELKSLAPPALYQLEAAYGRVRGQGVTALKNAINNSKERVRHIEFAFDGASRRITETVTKDSFPASGTTSGASSIFVASPNYCFRLQRKTADKPYATIWMGRGEDKPEYDGLRDVMDTHNQMFCRPFILPTELRLATLIRHPSFVAKEVSSTTAAGLPAVRVVFEASAPDDKQDPLYLWRNSAPLSGWFVACPQQSWALHAYELNWRHQKKIPMKDMGTLEYQGGDRFPLLKRAKNVMYANGRVSTEESIELSDLSFGPSPAEEFSPAAFGLAAADPAPRGQRSIAVWVLLIGCLSLGVAVGLRLMYRLTMKR